MMDNPDLLSGATLAYLGDSVFELTVRQSLVAKGITDVGKLNALALAYVKATAQSEAVEKIMPCLTEEELAVFKRGRNSHSVSIPKSAGAVQYRRATGLEALFGWLWLNGKNDRINELFRIGYEN